MLPTFAEIKSPTLRPTLNLVPKSFLGHKYLDMSLMMAQSALRCSLLETVCSAKSGSVFTAGAVDFCGFTAPSGPTFSSPGCFVAGSVCATRARASSFLCRGVLANMRFACHEACTWSARAGLLVEAAAAARRHILLGIMMPRARSLFPQPTMRAVVLANRLKSERVFVLCANCIEVYKSMSRHERESEDCNECSSRWIACSLLATSGEP